MSDNNKNTAMVVRADDEPMTFGSMVEMGEKLVKTGFLPEHIKTGAQAAAIMLTGSEMGMGRMRALRSLYMVKGRVVEDAASQLARFKSDGGKAQFKQLDATRAVIWLRHRNGDEHTETYSMEDAKRAGLTGGNTWQKSPTAMLRSRAITAGLKSLGWEGSAGAYDDGEIDEAPPPDPVKRQGMPGVAPAVTQQVIETTSEPAPETDVTPAGEVVPAGVQDYAQMSTTGKVAYWTDKFERAPDRQAIDVVVRAMKDTEVAGSDVLAQMDGPYRAARNRTKPVTE